MAAASTKLTVAPPGGLAVTGPANQKNEVEPKADGHDTDMFVSLCARAKSGGWGEPDFKDGNYRLHNGQLFGFQVFGDSKYDALLSITIDGGAPIIWAVGRQQSLLIKNSPGGLAFCFKAIADGPRIHGEHDVGTVRVQAEFGKQEASSDDRPIVAPEQALLNSSGGVCQPRQCSQAGAAVSGATADGSTHYEQSADALKPTRMIQFRRIDKNVREWMFTLRLRG